MPRCAVPIEMREPAIPASRHRRWVFAIVPGALALAALLAQAEAAEGTPPDGEAQWAKALAPAEKLIRAWDFPAAAKTLGKLSFEDKALAERLAVRRAEVALLARLKAKFVEKVNAAQPRLRKSTLLIPGLNTDITKADDDGLYATLPTGAEERVAWGDLSFRSLRLLIQRAASKSDPDDVLAAAILALAQNETAAAEAYFADARMLGAPVGRHIAPLADAALGAALALVDQQRFKEAEEALLAIQVQYVRTPWLAAHEGAIEAARLRATGTGREAAAQQLYDQAARLFADRDFPGLKPLVEQLKADFAETRVVRDAARKPTVADLAAAAAKVSSKTLTVRQDGKGDFKTIQEAVAAAPAWSTVLVADGATYREIIRVPDGKEGLILRGQKGRWPTICSEGMRIETIADLFRTDSPNVTLEGFVLHHCAKESKYVAGAFACVDVLKPPVRVRSCILYMVWVSGQVATISGNPKPTDVIAEFDHCVILMPPDGGFWSDGSGIITMSNCTWLQGRITSRWVKGHIGPVHGFRFENSVLRDTRVLAPSEFRSCTIVGKTVLEDAPNLLRDCIAEHVSSDRRETTIEHCDLYGTPPYGDFAKPGKACFQLDPGFLDPARFDYRLRANSPCRGKASDGGDIGCRPTPAMIEILRKTLQLRDRSLLKFAAPERE